ncbi:ribonuclease P protein component [uncultured Lutibacter sp.]|uniref:ribonuclease P protein component n=1 Tax=uncultured Lutibacter sp. TaxID=437739 RepID=UPI00260AE87B|nr:ribonuclease P protein component [uncultured Lutibacter sp.]
MRFTLGIEEKLKSKKVIQQLFAEGNRVKSFPLQLIYLKKEHYSEFPIKVGFTVPKRAVKLAVNRNRIKRMMREVYRKNKQLFSENINEKYIFMLIYMTNEETKYDDLELSVKKVCDKFLIKIKEDEQN